MKLKIFQTPAKSLRCVEEKIGESVEIIKRIIASGNNTMTKFSADAHLSSNPKLIMAEMTPKRIIPIREPAAVSITMNLRKNFIILFWFTIRSALSFKMIGDNELLINDRGATIMRFKK